MEQFNKNTPDELINILNQFGIKLEIEKEFLNDVIKYLNG